MKFYITGRRLFAKRLLGYESCKEVTLARKYDYMEDHLFASLALNKHDFFGKQVNIIH